MRYLIDGYNLAHAMNLLTARSPAARLEPARRSLLDRLAAGHGRDAGNVVVVFDAKSAPPGVPARQEVFGIEVRFAPVADDHIEDLIAQERTPRQLTLVSDDRRLRQSAQRRGCPVLGCLDYLEQLAGRPAAVPPPRAAEPPAKPEGSSEETRYWLERFGGIDEDPRLRDGFDLPFRDGDDP
jgi:predicted RNA-binding protein with PIN domain